MYATRCYPNTFKIIIENDYEMVFISEVFYFHDHDDDNDNGIERFWQRIVDDINTDNGPFNGQLVSVWMFDESNNINDGMIFY